MCSCKSSHRKYDFEDTKSKIKSEPKIEKEVIKYKTVLVDKSVKKLIEKYAIN